MCQWIVINCSLGVEVADLTVWGRGKMLSVSIACLLYKLRAVAWKSG